jgi:hypothetical protein
MPRFEAASSSIRSMARPSLYERRRRTRRTARPQRARRSSRPSPGCARWWSCRCLEARRAGRRARACRCHGVAQRGDDGALAGHVGKASGTPLPVEDFLGQAYPRRAQGRVRRARPVSVATPPGEVRRAGDAPLSPRVQSSCASRPAWMAGPRTASSRAASRRRLRALVVVPEEVEQPWRMTCASSSAAASPAGRLALARLDGDGDVAEVARLTPPAGNGLPLLRPEGEHIGRLIEAAVARFSSRRSRPSSPSRTATPAPSSTASS